MSVFAYLDYRAALRDLYTYKKEHEYGFSYRAFSRRAGLKSTNFLKLVMDGKRNLSSDAAGRFAKALGLRGAAADYFCELVTYNQATTVRDKSRSYERLTRLQPEKALRQLETQQIEYYSHWYVPAIRELAACPDFRDDPHWIADRLDPPITPSRAKKALKTLLDLGLLTRDEQGQLRPTDALVTTGLRPRGPLLEKYHRTMMTQAREALDRFAPEEREIASLTLCIDQRMLPALKLRLQAFRREFMQYAEGSGTPERVMQVNFQMFPLSKAHEDNTQ